MARSTLKISVNPNVYLKNPESSELGKRIVSQGILLIDKLGFDDFTFRKLGEKIQSPEASVYRYFESKYKFLIYIDLMVLGLDGISAHTGPDQRLFS